MFQIRLSGSWQDFEKEEDQILKRAFLAGFAHSKYSFRKQKYEVDFEKMTQTNSRSGKSRQIRPPYRWKAPSAPITKPGRTACIKVPKGSPGSTIHVPHPEDKTQMIAVDVPAGGKVGRAMLVPVPPLSQAAAPSEPAAPEAAEANPEVEVEEKKTADASTVENKGTGTSAKVCLGAGGLAAKVAPLAVVGVILGEHLAGDDTFDATMAELSDGLAADGAGAADWVEAAAASEGVSDVAEDAGDYVIDLF